MERQILGAMLEELLTTLGEGNASSAESGCEQSVSREERRAVQEMFASLRSRLRRIIKTGVVPVKVPLADHKDVVIGPTLSRVSAPRLVNDAIEDEWHPFYTDWMSLKLWARTEGLHLRLHSEWERGRARRYFLTAKPWNWPDWDL